MGLKSLSMIANLLTIGNGVCGFAAVALVNLAHVSGGQIGNPHYLKAAAWLILLGMVFDVFDGKVARATGAANDLGAQLDSLCDLVTFGVAPAALVLTFNLGMRPEIPDRLWERWEWVVWCFSIAYFLGVVLRLARFNVEHDPDLSAHLCFKGLPSPAAAGTIASLVVFYFYVVEARQPELKWLANMTGAEVFQRISGGFGVYIPFILPPVALLLGYAMVSSRLRYRHLGNWIFVRRQTFDFLVLVIFVGILAVAIVPELILAIVFPCYVVATPAAHAVRLLWGREPASVEEASGG